MNNNLYIHIYQILSIYRRFSPFICLLLLLLLLLLFILNFDYLFLLLLVFLVDKRVQNGINKE